jgi:hypothetical protein
MALAAVGPRGCSGLMPDVRGCVHACAHPLPLVPFPGALFVRDSEVRCTLPGGQVVGALPLTVSTWNPLQFNDSDSAWWQTSQPFSVEVACPFGYYGRVNEVCCLGLGHPSSCSWGWEGGWAGCRGKGGGACARLLHGPLLCFPAPVVLDPTDVLGLPH